MRDWLLQNWAQVLGAVLAALAGILGITALMGVFGDNFGSTVNVIAQNARSGFVASNQGYTNFTSANVSKMLNIFPKSVLRNGTTPTDPWGNAMTFASANNATQGVITSGGGVTETVDGCASAAQHMSGYDTLVVGTTTFTPTNAPDASTAGSACASGTATLVYTFH